MYRQFFNVLARLQGDELVRYEQMTDHQEDWENRASAPYWLFDPKLSAFNVADPLHVATYSREAGVPEIWHRHIPEVQALENLMFVERGIKRRLRTARSGTAHAKLNLERQEGRDLAELRKALLQLVVSSQSYAYKDRVIEAVRASIGRNLFGLYVHGSLALEDFVPDSSDVDVCTVVTRSQGTPVSG